MRHYKNRSIIWCLTDITKSSNGHVLNTIQLAWRRDLHFQHPTFAFTTTVFS